MNTQTANDTSRSGDMTRLALISAGLQLFGQKGFEATSTREIAAKAEANIGSIAYHFGGKEGLRVACAEHIVTTMSTFSGQIFAAAPDPEQLTRDEAQTLLKTLVVSFVTFLLGRKESKDFVQFILRELAHPSVALDTVYNHVFEPMHKRLCDIWQAATGEDATSQSTKLTIFTLIGQIVYFRIGRVAMLRRMNWNEIGPEEIRAVSEAVSSNLEAILANRNPQASERMVK